MRGLFEIVLGRDRMAERIQRAKLKENMENALRLINAKYGCSKPTEKGRSKKGGPIAT